MIAEGYKRISNDDLRDMLDSYKFTAENEEYIRIIRQSLISLFMGARKNIVIDNTNLNPKCKKEVEQLIAQIEKQAQEKIDYTIEEEFIDTPLEECVARDKQRTGRHQVGEKVIRDMHARYLAEKPAESNSELPRAIICDIDGTLAQKGDRNIFDGSKAYLDTVHSHIKDIVCRFHNSHKVIIVSGRDDIHQDVTEQWLKANKIPYDEIYMRPTGDKRKDSIVKQEIYDNAIRDRYNVYFVLDDRDQVVKMWRENGLKCLQVAEGTF